MTEEIQQEEETPTSFPTTPVPKGYIFLEDEESMSKIRRDIRRGKLFVEEYHDLLDREYYLVFPLDIELNSFGTKVRLEGKFVAEYQMYVEKENRYTTLKQVKFPGIKQLCLYFGLSRNFLDHRLFKGDKLVEEENIMQVPKLQPGLQWAVVVENSPSSPELVSCIEYLLLEEEENISPLPPLYRVLIKQVFRVYQSKKRKRKEERTEYHDDGDGFSVGGGEGGEEEEEEEI
jgi:hypothetical protein